MRGARLFGSGARVSASRSHGARLFRAYSVLAACVFQKKKKKKQCCVCFGRTGAQVQIGNLSSRLVRWLKLSGRHSDHAFCFLALKTTTSRLGHRAK